MKQPTVALGREIAVHGRPPGAEVFILWSAGSKEGRYWAIRHLPDGGREEIEVRPRLAEDRLTRQWVEIR